MICVSCGADKKHRGRGLCASCYSRKWRQGEFERRPRTDLKGRIERNVRKSPITGCWNWQGTKSVGYGTMTVAGRGTVKACRIAYEIYKGAVPAGEVIRHECDNPACVNPEHLLIGTQADNVADMVSRNRHAKGRALPQTKLTPGKVRQIREDPASYPEISERFGISVAQVCRIKTRQAWKHVE